ncbi:hypothetical protein BD410DRAFT_794660 [Rickenella mellea]|uniref:DUF7918 domain-containing protein n=1 Tax=Rickenella mellea TaxID=50990 RepID=A0A4Y7PPZ0_9AGAM|nr:hypothetical protein BD410DRAFT_794660 [Rickenella mellea]
MRLHDYVAEVSCEGVVLEEYGTSIADDGKTVSCWIQSEAGKHFVITWKIDSEDGSRGILGRTYVDGSLIGCRACFGGDQRVNTKQYEGAEIDDTTCKPFRFAQIPLTDEPRLVAQRDLDSLGTIAVVMCQATKLVDSCTCKLIEVPVKLLDGPLNEREKKAGGHCAQLGDLAKRLMPASPVHSHWGYVDESKPLVTFRFTYRSKEFLQAQGIIPHIFDKNGPQHAHAGPRDESPQPELVGQVMDMPVNDQREDEDVDALQRKLEEMQKKIQRIKRTRRPNHSIKAEIEAEKPSKSESGTRHRANLKYIGGVIDLTND